MYNKDINIDHYLKTRNPNQSYTNRNRGLKVANIENDSAFSSDVTAKTLDALHRSLEGIKSQTNLIETNLIRAIRNHPIQTLGVGLLVGFLFAFLFHK